MVTLLPASYRTLILGAAAIVALQGPAARAQQVTDTTFRAPVENPLYPPGTGPRVLIDQAHFNASDADRYAAAADMLRRDGYVVGVLDGPITRAALEPARLLVSFIYGSSAWRAINALRDAEPSRTDFSAFTPAEVAAIRDWIAAGGALLLAVDHEPAPLAASELARALGVRFLNGIAYRDRTARLTFRREDSTLAEHPLTRDIGQVGTFGGSAFELERDGQPLLIFGGDVRAWVAADSNEISVAGQLQGAVFTFGEGRVAVFGEAGMFTAQLNASGNPMGMNAEIAKDNPAFLRNVVHWLTINSSAPPASSNARAACCTRNLRGPSASCLDARPPCAPGTARNSARRLSR